ncbi:MAG: bi-domain-containing oxidoreductase [Saprospiraceae bacterium]
MKQIIQDIRHGDTMLVETPVPALLPGHVLIRTHYSLVSAGTERMLVEFGKAGWIEKVKQQPDKVHQVISKIKSDGLIPTVEAVMRKLDQPIALGYCNAGVVIDVASDVTTLRVGDRVVSNGPHAEVVCVGKNLVSRIPDNVATDEAAFAVIAAIGLQGIRLVNPQLGEVVVVMGLGLIGQLTCQLLAASGCRVVGIDMNEQRTKLAAQHGIETILSAPDVDVTKNIHSMTGAQGADAVIITATSSSDELISQAARMSRKRGRIVLVGVIGLNIRRADFYEKELTFQVSCSYGPGRYDPEYEQAGKDYPYPFVRWTEQRNFDAVLMAMSLGRLKVRELISETVALDHYQQIYGKLGKSTSLASLLQYDVQRDLTDHIRIVAAPLISKTSRSIGLIGAGNFTTSVLMPELHSLRAPVQVIASQKGLSAAQLAKKYRIAAVTTNLQSVIDDDSIGAVMITTRHDSHAALVQSALLKNKHVFVEKPLAITATQLETLIPVIRSTNGTLTLGYNRRFSPAAMAARKFFAQSNESMHLVMNMNAGSIPLEHWTQHMETGGGRIIGEACHMIDLASFLTGSRPAEVFAQATGPVRRDTDNATILIRYENGSTAIISYFSSGNKEYPKERIEIHQNQTSAVIDNFKKLTFFGKSGAGWSGRQDKGHHTLYRHWLDMVLHGAPPVFDPEDLILTSKVSFAALESLVSGERIMIKKS